MKTVIFDFDGTIADTLSFTWRKIINYLRQEKITDRHDEAIIEDIQTKSYPELVKHFKISWLKIPLIVFEIQRAQKDLYSIIDKIRPYDGIKTVIQNLKNQGYKLGVLSSNRHENVSKFLKLNDINLFDFILCKRNLFGKDKVIKHILKKYSLNKNETIYIADEVRDIQACKKAGIKCISVSWGFNKKSLLSKYHPDWMVDRPEEIPKILNS